MVITRKSDTSDATSPKLSTYSRRLLFGTSPWLVVSLSAILALAIFLLSLRNTAREQEHITQNFLDRADALIWALEANTRAGIDRNGEVKTLQPFIMETARQRGVLYIAIIDEDGLILAHSNPQDLGNTIPKARLPSAEPPQDIAWHTIRGSGHDVFEVYREFSPAPGYHHNPWGFREVGRGHHEITPVGKSVKREPPRSFALIGFDSEPYETMLAKERFNNLVTTIMAVILALGSVYSLFWADSYQRSRRLLKDTRALASEVVSSLPIGLISCEPGNAVAMVNETALSMLRMEKEMLVGASIHTIPGLNWKKLIDVLAQNKKVIECAMEFNVNGDSMPVLVSASRIRDEEGLFLGHIFILRDISDMKRLQDEARRNEKFAILGSLAAGVAHEIRNPLSSIKGAATLLLAKMHASVSEEEAAQTLITEADRLNRVVAQLLEFAKPNIMKLADTNINEVIIRALRLADADIRAKKIHVTFVEDKTLPLLSINAERFTQALLNLFLNAVQAMELGGHLEATVNIQDKEDTCSVCVKDDGKGMSQQVQSSIFTPYFTTKSSGTGLGLAIVHQIVEGHGGSISVKSTPGAGSAFTLFIPMRKPHKEDA